MTTYFCNRRPRTIHDNPAIIRGDLKDPFLNGPSMQLYKHSCEYIRRLLSHRQTDRIGSIGESMFLFVNLRAV